MKKILQVSFVFLGLLLMSGCSQQKVPSPTDSESMKGIEVPNNEKFEKKEISDKETPKPSEEKATFAADNQGNYFGVLTVTGYPVIMNTPEPFCEKDCKNYEYVYFQIMETNSTALYDFLGINKGNSFIGEKQVGIGCRKSGAISYYNDSNQLGMKEYYVYPDISKKILSASKNDPVAIRLERLLFTGGSGAPACYSHFTYISLADKQPIETAETKAAKANEAAAKELLEKEIGANTISGVVVTEATENFMRGTFDTFPSAEDLANGRDFGSGGIFLAARVNGVWKLIFDGNGQIECSLVNPYGFPANMISDCVN